MKGQGSRQMKGQSKSEDIDDNLTNGLSNYRLSVLFSSFHASVWGLYALIVAATCY